MRKIFLYIRKFSIFIVVMSVWLGMDHVVASDSRGTVNASYYWDERDFNTVTLQLAEPSLPFGLSVWGFSDFHSDQNEASQRDDFTRVFSEYRLSSAAPANLTGIKGLGMQLEYNDFIAGNNNTTWRAGFMYKRSIANRLWFQLRLLPVQSNNDRQISLIYKLTLTPRFRVAGFADYNIREGKDDQWVVEPQIEYKAMKNTWLLLEYRYNGFEDANILLDGSGWAIGFRYHL